MALLGLLITGAWTIVKLLLLLLTTNAMHLRAVPLSHETGKNLLADDEGYKK